MCRIHQLSTAEKITLRDQLLEHAASIGGKNSFLKLIETIRKTSPHPLVSKTPLLRFPKGLIKWSKNIHRDNLTLLSTRMNARTPEDQNLMVAEDHPAYKKVTNMLRSLGPLSFTVAMNSETEGPGFTFKAFTIVDEATTLLDPIFELLFFCPVAAVKKLMHFTPPSEPGGENSE
jgi:hypothetical protein